MLLTAGQLQYNFEVACTLAVRLTFPHLPMTNLRSNRNFEPRQNTGKENCSVSKLDSLRARCVVGSKMLSDEVKAELRRFVDRTSVRGIGRVLRSDDGATRAMWFVAVVACLSFAVYQLSTTVASYFRHPVSIHIYTDEFNPTFPDVTVCRGYVDVVDDWPTVTKTTSTTTTTYRRYLDVVEALERRTSGRGDDIINSSTFRRNRAKIFALLKLPNRFFVDGDGVDGATTTTKRQTAAEATAEAEAGRTTTTTATGRGDLVREVTLYTWLLDAFDDGSGGGDPTSAAMNTMTAVVGPYGQPCVTICVPDAISQIVRRLSVVLFVGDNVVGADDYDEADSSSVSPPQVDFFADFGFPQSSGAAVYVHQRGGYPTNAGLRLEVAAGAETTVAVRSRVRTRLPAPYGGCRDDFRYLTPDGAYRPAAKNYATDACYDVCRQRIVMDRCRCVDSTGASTGVELATGLPFCGSLNLTSSAVAGDDRFDGDGDWNRRPLEELDCFLNVRESTDDDDCSCPLPCIEFQYQTSTSSARWPQRSLRRAFYDKYILNRIIRGKRFVDSYYYYDADYFVQNSTILRQNNASVDDGSSRQRRRLSGSELNRLIGGFLRVNVHFDARGVQMLNDTASMTWDALVAAVGGSLSLWIGVTAMTFVEIAELVYVIARSAVRRRCRCRRSSVAGVASRPVAAAGVVEAVETGDVA